MMFAQLLVATLAATAGAETAVVVLPQPPLDAAARTKLEVHGPAGVRQLVVPLERQTITIPTPGSEPLRLRCADPELWCQDLLLDADAEAGLPFPIFREARLSGRLQQAPGRPPVDRLVLQGWVDYSEDYPPLLFVLELPVEKGEFHGTVPLADLDLRIAVAGSAPLYRWNVHPGDDGKLDLGELRLVPGGSLSGFLYSPAGEPAGEGHLALEPLVAGVDLGTAEKLSRMGYRARPDESGFFQFLGVEPGRYRLTAADGELGRGGSDAVEIAADEELHLPRVEVRQPLELRVRLTPPAPPQGGRWSVVLVKDAVELPRVEAGNDGEAKLEGLLAGDYELAVVAPSGTRMFQEPLTLGGDETLDLRLDLLEVQGSVAMGGESLVARVVVETGRGDLTTFESGYTGRFSGWLPNLERPFLRVRVLAPQAELDRSFELAGDQVEVEDDVLQLDIDLPDVELRGRVVDGLGQPIAGASVAAWEGWLPAGEARSDEEGRFEIEGLEHGTYWVTARHESEGGADPVRVTLSEGDDEVEVVLAARAFEGVQGSLSTPDGRPVVGAQISIASVGSAFDDFVTTDAAGRFGARVLAGTSMVSIVVLAPSRSLWAACLPVRNGQLTLAAPDEASGLVEILVSWKENLPPAAGSLVLVNERGGVISADVRGMWTGAGATASPAPGVAIEKVPALAAGLWAATLVDEPGWKVIGDRCSAPFGAEPAGEALLPAGELRLEVDLEEHQRRRLR